LVEHVELLHFWVLTLAGDVLVAAETGSGKTGAFGAVAQWRGNELPKTPESKLEVLIDRNRLKGIQT
jgi:hypothetical protein